ncbi:MAG: hypothetical protein LBH69_01995 [Methanomassiliicoccaceae archaeon]|nr:hypothetical protein [Methanomassiliicoccaceae archaeon]
MNLEKNTSAVLRYGSTIGIAIVALGVLVHLIDASYSEMIMTTGISVIVLTPFGGLIITYETLSSNWERRYAAAALALIVITIAGMLIALWFQRHG